ncbi:MAG: hypothetical protein J6L24_06135 [Oscillospiraceae bacterium]|nr:hypothetical protein [Oscillospiraceae bacterium]
MKKTHRSVRILAVIGALLVLLSATIPSASAENVAYDTLTSDKSGEGLVKTQTAYVPDYAIEKLGDMALKDAQDLFIFEDRLYICDTGNARIVVGSLTGELQGTLGEETLAEPTGVCVASDGTVYVADQGAEKVFAFSAEGDLIRTYERPTEPYYGKTAPYVPIKVSVGNGDNLFVLSKGNTNGVLQLSRETGEFLGYFGANNVSVSVWEQISDLIFTEEQKAQTSAVLPPSATNIAIDEKGMVYVLTNVSTAANMQLRKLNMAGVNVLENEFMLENPAALCVGTIGNLYVATYDGYILEFDAEGNLLFLFGSPDDGSHRVGLMKSVSGISIDSSGKLYVLDNGSNSIQVFAQTDFSKTVHQALDLYQQGKYLQCKEPWEDVLSLNSLFTQAQSGIAEAYYMEGDYAAAMDGFRLGNDQEGYSRAFKQARNEWLRSHLEDIFLIAVVAVAVLAVVRKVEERTRFWDPVRRVVSNIRQTRLMTELLFLFAVPRNPADAAYGIKREHKTSVLSATVLYLFALALVLLEKYAAGYIFKTAEDGRFSVVNDILIYAGSVTLVVLCHYLICAITDGEASLANVYSGMAYACMPFIVLKPIAIVLTHVLSLQEQFILHFLNFVIYAGSAVLIVVMIRELNDYTYKKTFRNIFLTVFAVVIAVAVLFVLYILSQQFFDFILSLWREVIYRAEL